LIDNPNRRTLHQQSRGKKTPNEQAEIEEKRNVLRRRIKSWLEVHGVYIPAQLDNAHLEHDPVAPAAVSPLPELIPLRLPSALTPNLRASCLCGLPDLERRLRLAQAEDALAELRRLLRITMGLTHYKATQVGPSQRTSTRARALISRFWDKIARCAERYRVARAALLVLDANGDWCTRLRPLEDQDIKAPRKDDDEAEGTRELSWIWRVERQTGLRALEENNLTEAQLVECMSILLCFIHY
jgi:hypothetical protein